MTAWPLISLVQKSNSTSCPLTVPSRLFALIFFAFRLTVRLYHACCRRRWTLTTPLSRLSSRPCRRHRPWLSASASSVVGLETTTTSATTTNPWTSSFYTALNACSGYEPLYRLPCSPYNAAGATRCWRNDGRLVTSGFDSRAVVQAVIW